MIAGCGGGFDFVHSLTFYPELIRMGKKVVIGSYSFGLPENIKDPAKVIFSETTTHGHATVKEVSAKSQGSRDYAPEVQICAYLDEAYPTEAPHTMYAYYARNFTVPLLRKLYTQLIEKHSVDAFILIDGGTDSLMKGDENGLGDPIEDAVSVATVASLTGLKAKVLLSIGFGADRFNDVSDFASMRAVAELTAMGGFLGCVSIEPNSKAHLSYKNCVEKIYANQTFRSVLTGLVLAASRGAFGFEPPPEIGYRGKSGKTFLWPLMCILWAFDVDIVAKRSKIVQWIKDCTTVDDCYLSLSKGRASLQVLPVENFPTHQEMSN